MSKPFFFRIDAADLINFATDPEGEGMSLLRFAKELQKGESDIRFIQSIIEEANGYIEKKRRAGAKGGKARASNAQAMLSGALAGLSTPQASSSSSSSSSSINQTPTPLCGDGDDEQFFSMRELNALAVKYLGWNGNMNPGKAESLQPLTGVFREDVERGFRAACDAGSSSVNYVIKAAGNDNEQPRGEIPL